MTHRKHTSKSILEPPGGLPDPLTRPDIDIALGGEGNDRLGLGCSFISEFGERTITDPETLEEITDIRPTIVIEFAFAVEARAGEQTRPARPTS